MHLATQRHTANDPLPTLVARTLDALRPFEPSPHLAVAVSGGADSMALALTTHAWAQARGGHITALTIDHGLRAESAREVFQVQRWLHAYGIPCEVLRIKVPRDGNIPSNARDARYEALSNWCNTHAVLHLCIGHHADDQAETIALHTARGDTADGASGMPLVMLRDGVRILRPLLGIRKSTLTNYLTTIHQDWIEDPSNTSDAYARNRIRGTLDVAALHAHAAHEGSARNVRESTLAHHAATCVSLYPEGYAQLDLPAYRCIAPSAATLLLANMLRTLSGKATRPRQHETERLHTRLMQHAGFQATLMGYQVHSDGKQALFTREIARIPSLPLTATSGSVRYDAHFEVRWKNLPANHRLAPLGHAGIKQLPSVMHHLPKPALCTLPALWHLDEVVAVPHMACMPANLPSQANVTVTFSPPKPLAASPFWCLNAQALPTTTSK